MNAQFKLTHKSNWGKVAPKTLALLDAAVRTTAFEVERGAKSLAAVDTGAMRASVFTVTSKSSGMGAAYRRASHMRKEARLFGRLPKQKQLAALVAVGVEYGIYLEYGTARAAAHPFLGPATKAQRAGFRKRLADAQRRGAKP